LDEELKQTSLKQVDLELEFKTETIGKDVKFILPSGMVAVLSQKQLRNFLHNMRGKPVLVGRKSVGRIIDSWWDTEAIGIKVSVNKSELKEIGMVEESG
jgi:hypothetical protein